MAGHAEAPSSGVLPARASAVIGHTHPMPAPVAGTPASSHVAVQPGEMEEGVLTGISEKGGLLLP